MRGVRVDIIMDVAGAPVPVLCFALGGVEGGDARGDLEGHAIGVSPCRLRAW